MPRNSRSTAKRYAAISRRRRASGLAARPETPIERQAEEQPQDTPTPPTPPSQTTLPRVIIASQTRGPRAAAAVRPSTFEATDYSYVMKDLRRMSYVAGVLMAVLIALSFVVH